MMQKVVLKCNKISKVFHFHNEAIPVLENISLEITLFSKVGLFGNSGSGKSTLLYILSLLDIPDSGELFIDNLSISNISNKQKAEIISSKIGFIYQYPFLLSDLTVWENIALAGKIAEINSIEEETEKLLKILKIEDLHNKFPEMLSGGQKQRVAIARACIKKPLIIFADEPTSSLDSKTANIVLDLLFETVDHANSSLFMVTHNKDLKNRFDVTYSLANGQITPI